MTTFSQIVDTLTLEHLRPDMRANVAAYVNLTLRELHAGDNGGAILYAANLVEDTLTTTVAESHSWDIPRPHLFQKLAAARFDSFGFDRDAYASPRTPGAMFADSRYVKQYYRSGNSFAFMGCGQIGSTISLGWYEVPRRLEYYPAGDTRPCQWSEADQDFTYTGAYGVSETSQALAQTLCTNWILLRWGDLVMQGARAKIFARAGDEARSRLAYSSFSGLRPSMVSAETYEEA